MVSVVATPATSRSAGVGGRRARRVALAALALYPVIRVLIASRLGPGVSPDSVGYVSAARSFAATGHLVTYDGEPLTIWPPGFPVLLSTLAGPSGDLTGVAVALNALCVALIVLLTYRLGVMVLGSRRGGLAAAAATSVLGTPAAVQSMLWTEPLFTVLVLFTLVLLVAATTARTFGWNQLLLAGVMVSLACTIRYVGFTLIPVVGLAVLLGTLGRGGPPAWRRVRAVAVLTTAGLAAAAVRNAMLGAEPLGSREPSTLTALDVLKDGFLSLGSYLVPDTWLPVAVAVGSLVAVVLGAGIVRVVRRPRVGLLIVTSFVVVWWAAHLYSEFATRMDPVDRRLLAPIVGPSMILLVLGVQALLARRPDGEPGRVRRVLGRGRARTITACILAALMLTASTTEWVAVITRSIEGFGYQSTRDRTSPLLPALRALPADAVIASNEPAWVYWVAGRTPALAIPKPGHYWSETMTRTTVASLRERADRGELTHVVYFQQPGLALTAEELEAAGIPLCLLAGTDGGTVHRVGAC